MVLKKCLYGCVRVRVRVRVCVCVCACIRLDLSFYSVDFNRTGLIFVFLCDGGSKIRFSVGRCVFVLFRIFDFLKIYFRFLSIIGLRYFNQMGIIQKKTKIPIFSKKIKNF